MGVANFFFGKNLREGSHWCYMIKTRYKNSNDLKGN